MCLRKGKPVYRLYKEVHDPEGILATIPAIATALMGALTGNFLRMPDEHIPRLKKGLWIGAAGIVSLGIGWLSPMPPRSMFSEAGISRAFAR